MNDNYLENNQVELVGCVFSELKYSHEVYSEIFYSFSLKVPRLSEISDMITITVSERLLSITPLEAGKNVFIKGQFRSYNNYGSSGSKLVLTVFAKDIEYVEDMSSFDNPNSIYLNGFICKPPVYRTTPFGREIADILLAVNRSYNKSDYIPCIAWGRNAKFAGSLEVGENLKIWGRIQSREYQKKISDTEIYSKIAYEISISKMEVCSDKTDFDFYRNEEIN